MKIEKQRDLWSKWFVCYLIVINLFMLMVGFSLKVFAVIFFLFIINLSFFIVVCVVDGIRYYEEKPQGCVK